MIYVEGISVLGPGLADWPTTRAVLRGERTYTHAAAILPPPALLPPAERRRVGRVVKLAIAIGLEASAHAAMEPESLTTVFASSNGDVENCHEICVALAAPARSMSPTRFHNSVQNAPAGYWGIATGAMAPSTMICAYDGSFAAGLLEASAQIIGAQRPVLLIAYDADYPFPLREKRPMLDTFGVALVLSPERSERSVAALTVELSDGPVDSLANPHLERLRTGTPAARALPLLEWVARAVGGSTRLEYLDAMSLQLEVRPC